jgi:hypothetical protein
MKKFFLVGAVAMSTLFGVSAQAVPLAGSVAIEAGRGSVAQKVWCDWYCRHHYWHHDYDHYGYEYYRHRDYDRDYRYRDYDRDYRYRDYDHERDYHDYDRR